MVSGFSFAGRPSTTTDAGPNRLTRNPGIAVPQLDKAHHGPSSTTGWQRTTRARLSPSSPRSPHLRPKKWTGSMQPYCPSPRQTSTSTSAAGSLSSTQFSRLRNCASIRSSVGSPGSVNSAPCGFGEASLDVSCVSRQHRDRRGGTDRRSPLDGPLFAPLHVGCLRPRPGPVLPPLLARRGHRARQRHRERRRHDPGGPGVGLMPWRSLPRTGGIGRRLPSLPATSAR
jgi:hypothetical protein